MVYTRCRQCHDVCSAVPTYTQCPTVTTNNNQTQIHCEPQKTSAFILTIIWQTGTREHTSFAATTRNGPHTKKNIKNISHNLPHTNIQTVTALRRKMKNTRNVACNSDELQQLLTKMVKHKSGYSVKITVFIVNYLWNRHSTQQQASTSLSSPVHCLLYNN